MRHRLLIMLLLPVVGCSSPPPAGDGGPSPEPDRRSAKVQEFQIGTVVDKRGLDGCTYLIELATGKRLEPVNLPDDVRSDGLSVYVRYEKAEDRVSTCMAGELVRITEIKTAN